MKGLSFWQWLGIVIIIIIIGGLLFRLLYGKKIIDAQTSIYNNILGRKTESPQKIMTDTESVYSKYSYFS